MSRREDAKEYTHPSYAMVGIARATGTPRRLFGSPLRGHSATVTLAIHQARRRHDLSRDWYYADDLLIEIEMSQAQFAELITTPNVGNGVPATLRYLGGTGPIEHPPADDTLESDDIQTGFDRDVRRIGTELDMLADEAERILGRRGNVSATEKKALLEKIRRIRQSLQSNLPYVLESFHKSATKVVSAAKAEVDAFITNAIRSSGIRALSGSKPDDIIDAGLLPPGTPSDDDPDR